MDSTIVNLKDKESSASGDSDKGSCTEAPQTGEAGWDPVQQGAGETPLTGEERPSPSSFSLENLEGLTEKVGTLGLQVTRKNGVVLPKSEQGGLCSQRLFWGLWRWPTSPCSRRSVTNFAEARYIRGPTWEINGE